MKLNIRKAQLQDCKFIVDGNCAMAKETENKILDNNTVAKGVTSVLEDNNKGFYIVAEYNDEPVGQLMITYEWSDWRNGTFWWIQSVYIISSMRRCGVYRQMYEYIKNISQQNNVCGIRLYVDKSNQVARKTYENLNMEVSHYDLMEEDFVFKNP